ncbi:serine/threonine protein kinase [Roseiflexus sp.]|uniref:serine/threonine protein kinase n=1 Tax=Roseiflexus sp. TaxID=2562120 RepID=UPI00398AC2AD
MNYLTSGISGVTYRVGPALSGLDGGFYRGFAGTQEVTLQIAPAGTAAVAALRAEARLLERLDHPQIVRLIDRGRTHEAFFLVFDTHAGRPLVEVVHQFDLSLSTALNVLVQAVDILAVLHQAGIIWGRMRPQAFWIDKGGLLKLVDLRGAGEAITDGSLTLSEATYLAPELSADQRHTERSDLYAVGVLAYELLAGRAPFTGSDPTELALKHLTEPPPDVAQTRSDLPADLCDLIRRCLSKTPEARPASALELRAELAAIWERVRVDEQGRMIICPRCQSAVLPARRCPVCGAQLQSPGATPPPPRKRRWLPMLTIGVSILALIWMLFGMGHTSSDAAALQPTRTPAQATAAATPLPTYEPTPLPTATAVPTPKGALTAAAGDMADADIDLIQAHIVFDNEWLVVRIDVVGRVEGGVADRRYQVFIDVDDVASGDTSIPWQQMGADYTVLFRSGDQGGMALHWNGTSWESIGAATVETNGGTLVMRVPATWLGSPETLRYGVLAVNGTASLVDYIPARGSDPASAMREP